VLLSELSSFIRNHLHLKVPMDFGVSDIPKCINDVPKYFVLKSLNDVSVAVFRASPQLYAVGLHRLHYLFVQHQLVMYRRGRSSSHEPIHFLYFSPSSLLFFLTCAFQRSLAFGMRTSDLILRYAFACSYFSGRYLSVR
jgi:hypothetical protein